jgi:MFS family permease
MGICNTILIMGLLLTGLAKNSAMFLLVSVSLLSLASNTDTSQQGRYFMGLGAVAASAAARSYIVELAPAKHRGFFLGSYNVVQTMGSILCSGSAIGFGHMADNWAWRGLLLLGVSIEAIVRIGFTVRSSTSRVCTLFPSHQDGSTLEGERTRPSR